MVTVWIPIAIPKGLLAQYQSNTVESLTNNNPASNQLERSEEWSEERNGFNPIPIDTVQSIEDKAVVIADEIVRLMKSNCGACESNAIFSFFQYDHGNFCCPNTPSDAANRYISSVIAADRQLQEVLMFTTNAHLTERVTTLLSQSELFIYRC